MHLPKEGERKGREGKGTLLTTEKYYNPMLAFSLYLYFYIHSSNKSINFINAKLGVVQGVVHIFPTTQPPCYSFWTTPLLKTNQ